MFQSYLSKLFKKETGLLEDTLVPPLWGTREKNVFLGLFVQAAVRRGKERSPEHLPTLLA